MVSRVNLRSDTCATRSLESHHLTAIMSDVITLEPDVDSTQEWMKAPRLTRAGKSTGSALQLPASALPVLHRRMTRKENTVLAGEPIDFLNTRAEDDPTPAASGHRVSYGGVGPGILLRGATYKPTRGSSFDELEVRLQELEVVKAKSPASMGANLDRQMQILQDKETVWNWAQTYSCEHSRFQMVHSEAEVIKLVKANEKVRCAGAMHSSSPLSECEGVIISTKGLDRVLEINAEEMTCTCEAGVVVGVLIAHLHQAGFALPQMGTIDHQTIVGAMMTGTHGGGMHKAMHTSVLGVRMVLADGSVKVINDDGGPDSELLKWVFPSLGMLGIVTVVTIQIVPRYVLKATTTKVPLRDLCISLVETLKSNECATMPKPRGRSRTGSLDFVPQPSTCLLSSLARFVASSHIVATECPDE